MGRPGESGSTLGGGPGLEGPGAEPGLCDSGRGEQETVDVGLQGYPVLDCHSDAASEPRDPRAGIQRQLGVLIPSRSCLISKKEGNLFPGAPV